MEYKMVHEIISISASYSLKAINNFKCEAGILYYRSCSQIEAKSLQEWRICIRSEEEKQKILEACHCSDTGNFCVYYIQLHFHEFYKCSIHHSMLGIPF